MDLLQRNEKRHGRRTRCHIPVFYNGLQTVSTNAGAACSRSWNEKTPPGRNWDLWTFSPSVPTTYLPSPSSGDSPCPAHSVPPFILNYNQNIVKQSDAPDGLPGKEDERKRNGEKPLPIVSWKNPPPEKVPHCLKSRHSNVISVPHKSLPQSIVGLVRQRQ